MERFEFFQNWYHKENERHIAIHDALNMPIGVIATISAVFIFQINSFNFDQEIRMWVSVSFLFFLAVAFSFWLASIYYLIKCYNNFFRGYEYKSLPYASVVAGHYDKVEEFAKEINDPESTDMIFKKDLIGMFIEYLDRNTFNNDEKTTRLFRSKQALLGCILFSLMSLSFFSVNYLTFKDIKQPSEVIIKNFPTRNKQATNGRTTQKTNTTASPSSCSLPIFKTSLV